MSASPNLNLAADLAFTKLTSPEPYADVPHEMKESKTWVVWKYELDEKGKPTKPPSNAHTSGRTHASTTDPDTWADFHKAVNVANDSGLEGIGFIFKNEFQGADLDGVVQTVDGLQVISPFGLSVAKLVNSYVEYSPTQTGLHLIWESPILLPKGNRTGNHTLGGEIYDKNSPRFFTVTGDKVIGVSTDSITKITDPNTIRLLHFLVLNITNQKLTSLWTGEWQKATDAKGKKFSSQSEADLSLCGLLVRGGFNSAATLDAAFRQSGLMRDDWEHKSKYSLAKALNGHESNDAKSALDELVFSLPAVETTEANDGDYVLARILDQSDPEDDGWFPRGAVSLVGAPSGAGKTTTMYQLLLTQASKGVFLGHGSYGLSFCVLGVDRGEASHRRTMRRMRLKPGTLPFEGLNLSHDAKAVQQIIEKIETYAAKNGGLPAIVLVEGVDMLLTKVNDILCVSNFMNLLNQVARRYHTAIIGTLGAPKIKVGQGYTCLRDNVLGSGGWSRECEAMVILQYPESKGTNSHRVMSVLLRNGKDETFTLGFDHGLLEQVPDIEADDVDSSSVEIEWYQAQARLAKKDPAKKWWTIRDLERALKLSPATAARHVSDDHAKRHIAIKEGKRNGQAKQYRWNESKTNPIWVEQQAQDSGEPQLTF